MKQCSKCKEWFPRTSEYFFRHKRMNDGLQAWCKTCLSRSKRQWEKENPAKVSATKKKTRSKYKSHIQEYNRAYHQRRRSELVARMAKRRDADRASYREYHQRWRSNHGESVRVTHHKRRVHIGNSDKHFTKEDVKLQYRSQKGLCWWCGQKLGKKWDVDHRIPLDKGGSNSAGNIVIAHPRCNQSKGSKFSWEWNGRLL